MTFVGSFEPTISVSALLWRKQASAPKHVPLGTESGSHSQQWGANLPPMRIYPIILYVRMAGIYSVEQARGILSHHRDAITAQTQYIP